MEHAAGPPHEPPPLGGLLGGRRLAERLAVHLEHGVGPEHEGVAHERCDGGGLGDGELDDEPRDREVVEAVLGHAADDDLGIEPGVAQQPQPRGRRRGQDQPAGHAVSETTERLGRAAYVQHESRAYRRHDGAS